MKTFHEISRRSTAAVGFILLLLEKGLVLFFRRAFHVANFAPPVGSVRLALNDAGGRRVRAGNYK